MKIELNDETYSKVLHLLCHHEVDLEADIKDAKKQIADCEMYAEESCCYDAREFWEDKVKFWKEALKRDMEELEETKATTAKLISAPKEK